MNNEKRRHTREKIVAEVFYLDEKDKLAGGCVAKDVCESGVCIKIKEFFPIGTILDLQFRLPLSSDSFNVKGKIKWINKTPYGEQWEAGMEILPDNRYMKLVRQYILLKKSSTS